MKRSLILYAFIIAVIFNVYTYVYLNKQVKFEQTRYEKLRTHKNDTIKKLVSEMDEVAYFTLLKNDNAINYFENDRTGEFFEPAKLETFVVDALLDCNNVPGGNIYTGYEEMNGAKSIINKAKVLNHRWIIADFTVGKMWGEAIIKYFINEDKTVSFENAETVLYPKSAY